jgi:PAS domain S-box-containing protein
VALDDRGAVTFFSPGAERITGWRQNETLNRPCDDLFYLAETSDTFSQHIPLPGQQSKILLELEDGRHITLGITSALLSPPDTGETGLVLVLRDISEAELIHHLLGGFLANITHEFRTPLSALAASTELLLDQAPDLSPAELQELLTSLYMGIVSLQTLIDNLLESASLEAGRFRVYPRPSDLGEIIAEAAHMTQPLQEKYGQSLVVELPATVPLVQADSRRIVQVLVNLLFNAIKYSPDETKITLSAIVSQDWVRVTVADQGPGVPPGRQDELFYRFVHYDADDAKSRHGAGLGLSVVKAIIEAHSGQVGVDSQTGGGAIFWFTLPVIEEQVTE